MELFKHGKLLVVTGIAGLALMACGDPSGPPPQTEQGGIEFDIDIDGKTKTKTVTANPTVAIPKYVPPPVAKTPVKIPKYTPAPPKKTK